MKRIVLNEMSYFGAGSRTVLPEEIKRRGYTSVLLVSDKDLVRFGIVKSITSLLEEANIQYRLFTEIKQNPTVTNVQDGLAVLKECGADVIVALGGGSAIDTAKAIGIISNNPDFSDVVSLEGVADTTKKSLPIIALPTTAGTAAEVTINYVITDEQNAKKMVCVDPKDIPVLAIVDAELMSSMPKGLTAATGMDALTHAIEGYITLGAWELTNMFHLEAIKMIAKYLPLAVADGADMEAREKMALAQYVAGMGFSNVGLGLVHGMAHPLGAMFDVPHGVANALLLPYVMQFNMESSMEKYADIAVAMGVDVQNLSLKEKAQAAVDAVRKLSIDVNIPQKLSMLGVDKASLPALSQAALADVCTPGNPRKVELSDILSLYELAF
ncbi:MAG TPA: lactaldehyde reductase [Candidatus Barnesiella excrementigallinarum]|nr:lactaldehyde reductase [Candidatus Barnesiella excrementigallinarum]